MELLFPWYGVNMNIIKVIIVDDHELVRSGLKNFFSIYDELSLLADVSSGRELLDLKNLNEAHVILMDIKMPEMDGPELCSKVKKLYPNIKVLALTSFTDTDSTLEMFEAGAEGVVFKDISPGDLLNSIKKVHRGHKLIDEKMKKLLKNRGNIEKPQLTSREEEILKLLLNGLSNKKISQELYIATSTVKYHMSNIFLKMGVTTRTEVVTYALQNKLVN